MKTSGKPKQSHWLLDSAARKAGYPSYRGYLAGKHWISFRIAQFRSHPHCRICGKKSQVVHHTSYERLGREWDSDVVVLCNRCHDRIHEIHREYKVPLRNFSRAVKYLNGPPEKQKRRILDK